MDIRCLSVLRGESGQRQNGVSRRDGLMVRPWYGISQHWEGVIKSVSSTNKLDLCCYLSQLSVEKRAGDCHWKKTPFFSKVLLSPISFFERCIKASETWPAALLWRWPIWSVLWSSFCVCNSICQCCCEAHRNRVYNPIMCLAMLGMWCEASYLLHIPDLIRTNVGSACTSYSNWSSFLG